MKFRPVRSTFAEAMRELVEINSLEQLTQHIAPEKPAKIIYQCEDHRSGWEGPSYLLMVWKDFNFNDGALVPGGYLDGPLERLK